MVQSHELVTQRGDDMPFLIVIRRNGDNIPTHLPVATVHEVAELLRILARPESNCYAYWMVRPDAPAPVYLAGRYRADVRVPGERLTHLFHLEPGLPSTATLAAACREPVPAELLDLTSPDTGTPCVDCLLMVPLAHADEQLRVFVEQALTVRYVPQPAPEPVLAEPMRSAS